MGPINGILWMLGIFFAIYSDPSFAQTKRSSRLTSSRSFGINVKSATSSGTSTTGIEFDCPEEFGYYPHPADCTQYYVCVFGGALLESCTGGLMYSHELQTCDWPRNVGCELTEVSGSGLTSSQSSSSSSSSGSSLSSSAGPVVSSSGRDISSRVPQQVKQQQQQQQQQQLPQVPSRVRFSSLTTGIGGQNVQKQPSQLQQLQQHQRQSQQHLQAQIQSIPPPPELRIAPNPIITSRGQPKPLLDSQEDIAKLYAEAHETLPPAEEEETDRQQRVYRGQPSTVGQVQRDRDGIIHHANANALPNHGKIGSYAFGTQSNQFSDEIYYLNDINDNVIDAPRTIKNSKDEPNLNRKRRETTTDKDLDIKNHTKTDLNYFDIDLDNFDIDDIDDYNAEMMVENNTAHIYGRKLINVENKGNETYNATDIFRSTRQLRTSIFTSPSGLWQFPNSQYHFAQQPSTQQQQQRLGPKTFQSKIVAAAAPHSSPLQSHLSGSYEAFGPYLSPPAFGPIQFSKASNINSFRKPFRQIFNNNNNNNNNNFQQSTNKQNKNQQLNEFKPSPYYNFDQLLPIDEPFRPFIASTIKTTPSTAARTTPASALIPSSILADIIRETGSHKSKSPIRTHQLPDNFSYFRLGTNLKPNQFSNPVFRPIGGQPDKVTPTNHFTSFSTVGGFFNNNNNNNNNNYNNFGNINNSNTSQQQQHQHHHHHQQFQTTPKIPKVISHFSITPIHSTGTSGGGSSVGGVSSTESNYFSYNILQNQKMKNYYATTTTTPNPTTLKTFPFVGTSNYYSNAPFDDDVTPSQPVTSNHNNFKPHETTTSRITGFFITPTIKSPTPIKIPTKAPKKGVNRPGAGIQGPTVGLDFDFNKFVADIRETHIAQMDPKIMNMLNLFNTKGIFNPTKINVTKRPNQFNQTTPKFFNHNYYNNYYDGNKGGNNNYYTTQPIAIKTSTIIPTVQPPKQVKGYENFIKSISPQKIHPSTTVKNVKDSHYTKPYYSTSTFKDDGNAGDSDEYYYDDDDDDDDSEDEDYRIRHPPSEKPPYMPNSETMSPPKPFLQVTTPKSPTTTTTLSNSNANVIGSHYKNHYYSNFAGEFITKAPPSPKTTIIPSSLPPPPPTTTLSSIIGTLTTTSTRRPQLFSSHYSDGNHDKHKIPSFINFPADVFQNIAPMNKYHPTFNVMTTTTTMTTMPPTTMTTTIIPPSTTTTINPYENFEISKISPTIASDHSGSIKSTTLPSLIHSTKPTKKIYTIRPNRGNLKWKLNNKTTDKPNSRKRPVQQQIEIDDKFSNRVETSSQAPPPPSANIFITQQRQKPAAAEQNTRNYYNTSNQSYDPYDTYYSVYDDDVDLYRDVEYTQQHQRGKTQQQQSTYRPEVITTPTPQIVQQQQPVRETYVSKTQGSQHQQQSTGQQYSNQPSLVYNTDYEDALIAQIENNDDYTQPQRNPPIRGDRIEINSITDRPVVITSTLRTNTDQETKYTPATYQTISTTLQHPQQQSSQKNKPQEQSPTPQQQQQKPPQSTTLQVKPIPTRSMDQYSIVSSTQLPPTTSTTTTTISPSQQQSKQTQTTRSTLSEDGFNNKTTKSIIITLSASAGPKTPQKQNTLNSASLGSSSISSNDSPSSSSSSPFSSIDSSSSSPTASRIRNVEILTELQSTETTTNTTQQTEHDIKTLPDKKNQSRIISLTAGFSASTPRAPLPSSIGSGSSTLLTNDYDDDNDDDDDDQGESDHQKKRISSYVISDVEPHSFQPSQRSSPSSVVSTTSIRPRPISVTAAAHIPSDAFKNQKSIRFSLTSGLSGLSASSTQPSRTSRGRAEEAPIYTRTRDDYKRETIIEPTTYAPMRSWRLTRTSPSPFATQDTNALTDDSESKESDSLYSLKRHHSRDYVSGSASERTPVTERGNKNVQTFTTRALVFKDNLNKAFETTSSSKFVSPYKSLETILQETEGIKGKAIKTTLKNRYTTTSSPAPAVIITSQKPFRSYFLITAPPKNISTPSTTHRYYTSPTLSTAPSPWPVAASTTLTPIVSSTIRTTTTTIPTTTTTTTTTSTTPAPTTTTTTTTPRTTPTTTTGSTSTTPSTTHPPTYSTTTYRPPAREEINFAEVSPRGRARFTYSYFNSLDDEPTTYSPKFRFNPSSAVATATDLPIRRKIIRARPTTFLPRHFNSNLPSFDSNPKVEFAALKSESSEIAPEIRNEPITRDEDIETSDIDNIKTIDSPIFGPTKVEEKILEITERPLKLFSAPSPILQENTSYDNTKIIDPSEISDLNTDTEADTILLIDENSSIEDNLDSREVDSSIRHDISTISTKLTTENESSLLSTTPTRSSTIATTPIENNSTITEIMTTSITATTMTTTTTTSTVTPTIRSTQRQTTKYPKSLVPPRASRVNNAIKTSIAASRSKAPSALSKCADNTPNTKCNEIPSRTNTRNRGGTHYTNNDREKPATVTSNRGTHPPRSRPTLKPSGTIVSKAAEFIDIYKYPPTRPEPIYPQPTPDKTAAKCRNDICLLPDCYCGGKETPGDLPVESIPQIVLLTFDDSVNDLNKQLYTDLFEKGRVNPNGCPISATFYVSHEWTDYSQVQNLYADGHEMASHTISHSFGEQFSQKKWTREVAGQREILAAYGGVKLSDVRGMRAPFLSIGGNKMFKMLYDSNFTYDSSMPVYENRPPSWPYTLDYKIFHDCMIPPCPTKSYPGVWEVPMVMWQDLNGGRCSMGDACANPGEADGVYKMLMKNFERHYTTNRAPFGLFYHAAWFTQPHHKEGFINFLDAINAMNDVWIVTNWQALQWVRDPTPISRMNQFQPFQCDYSDRPKRCNNPKVCNLWHKSGVRYMRTCQPCPDIYPWTGKTGIRSSRVDNEIIEE